jgi:RNA polymerase sigma factor (sigma-70 family)
MSEPRTLVEHFFRHEFGRLAAVLTRSLGVRRLDLVEDVVQAALVQALETWSRRGVPEDPAGWLYRTARNLAIDALRRERTHAQALPRLAEDAERESSPLEAHFADEIGDEPLRLLFVCCHEAVPAESRVALALRTLCGFSTAEIARALLTTDANVQKRIERARDRLRALDVDFDTVAKLAGKALQTNVQEASGSSGADAALRPRAGAACKPTPDIARGRECTAQPLTF